MVLTLKLAIATLACAFIPFAATAAGAATPADTATARQAVKAVEEQWSRAFLAGDAATLDQLLDADYVSVSATGAERSRQDVIALARAYAEKHPGATASPLPPSSIIRIAGDSAVVQHKSDKDVSVDVLHYSAGQWHAMYSQHTAVAP